VLRDYGRKEEEVADLETLAQIGEHQIVQSHTIFRSMVPKYADKPILVVGGIGDNCRQIAEA